MVHLFELVRKFFELERAKFISGQGFVFTVKKHGISSKADIKFCRFVLLGVFFKEMVRYRLFNRIQMV